jgi:hypothetical protein
MGCVSDLYPICGMHRKPYLILGSLIYSIPFLLYALTTDDDAILLAICLLVSTIGIIMMDVMADTMVCRHLKSRGSTSLDSVWKDLDSNPKRFEAKCSQLIIPSDFQVGNYLSPS